MLPCQSYYVTAGNILRDPWDTIWRGELFRSFRDRVDDPIWAGLPQKCWDCTDLPLCGGGCRIEREARDGFRLAEDAYAAGCTGCNTRTSHASEPSFQPISLVLDGFIPSASLTNPIRRGSGVV